MKNTAVSPRPEFLAQVAAWRAALDIIFPNWSISPGGPNRGSTLQQRTYADLQMLFEAITEALDALTWIHTESTTVRAQAGTFTSEAIERRVAAIQREGDQKFTAAYTTARVQVGLLANIYREQARAQRPGTPDAAQEAALANMRTDLSMLLGRADAGTVCDRLEQAVTRAVSTDDQLLIWFIVESGWVTTYLASRGFEAHEALAQSRIADALRHVEVDIDRSQAIRALRVVCGDHSDGSKAIERIDVWLPAIKQAEIDD